MRLGLASGGCCCGTVARRRSRQGELRLEYRLLGKVSRNFDRKIVWSDRSAGVAVRSSPPNCKMDACIELNIEQENNFSGNRSRSES